MNNCTQCQALMINGVYCHEAGCPVARKERDDQAAKARDEYGTYHEDYCEDWRDDDDDVGLDNPNYPHAHQ